MGTWVLVADASRARLFSINKANKPWTLEQELEHPESRAKGIDLITDKPGRAQQSAGGGHRPAMEERLEPKAIEEERFARELAHQLEQGQNRNAYESLVIVAPPHFLGLLRKQLSPPVQKLVRQTFDKDYTQTPARDLPGMLDLKL